MRFAIAGVLALLVAGCAAGCTAAAPTGDTSSSAPTSAPTATSTVPAVPSLVSVEPARLDAASAKSETERLASAIEALVDPSLILHIDKHAQLVPADETEGGGAYYGDLLTISLEPGTDPNPKAQSIVASMEASGWTNRQATDESGLFLTALTARKTGWFVLVGADTSTAGQSVLTLQIASPDL